MRPRVASTDSSPKISVQYRTREGRAYEFTSLQNVVFLSISNDGDEAGERVWHAQAKSLRHQLSTPVDGWGNSPANALLQVAGAWDQQAESPFAFDWAAAGDELRRVRAI